MNIVALVSFPFKFTVTINRNTNCHDTDAVGGKRAVGAFDAEFISGNNENVVMRELRPEVVRRVVERVAPVAACCRHGRTLEVSAMTYIET